MKSIGTQLIQFLHHRAGRRNVLLLVKFLLFFAVMITVYSVLFHILKDTSRHVVVTSLDPVSACLIGKLDQYGYPYVLIIPDIVMSYESERKFLHQYVKA